MVITYTCDFFKEYAIGLRQCDTRRRLSEFLEHWLAFASDAIDARPKSDTEFVEFSVGLRMESRGKYAGDEWAQRFGTILMPEILFQVAVISQKFNVPWGTAFTRCQDVGFIRQNQNGVYLWVGNQGEL